MAITINCDIGEGYGLYTFGNDERIMPFISIANVACGFHASDPTVMHATVRLALEHGVKVGAHPSLPDRQGFGRREMQMERDELRDLLIYQVGALKGFLEAARASLNHIKPHGALFGMTSKYEHCAEAAADAAEIFGVPLIGQAGTMHDTVYTRRGLPWWPEFYADLEYDRDCNLIITRQHEPYEPAAAAKRTLRAISDLWFAEDYFMLSGFASAGIALQATDAINVGIGAVSNRVRHPAVTAMEASTLANAYPGRFTLGIGHGVPAWVAQMHLTPKSVLGSIGEAIADVKRLLAGERLTQQGAYYGYDKVALTHPAPDLKVLAAVVGPRSVDLCAEIADGMVVSVLAGPRYVAAVKERIAAVRHAHGLSDDFEIVVYALACVGEDRVAAYAKVRPVTAFYLEAMGPTLITGVYDANETLAAMIEAGGAAAIESDMPEDWLDWLVVAGRPDDCRAGIEAFFEAGATRVVLCVVPSQELPTQLEILGSEVLPGL